MEIPTTETPRRMITGPISTDYTIEIRDIALSMARVLAAIAYTAKNAHEDDKHRPGAIQEACADGFWLAQTTSFLNRLIDAMGRGKQLPHESHRAISQTSELLLLAFRGQVAGKNLFPNIPGDEMLSFKRAGIEDERQNIIATLEEVKKKADAAVLWGDV